MQTRNLKQELRSYLLIAMGMLIYAVAALGFLVPHKIVGGGATGLSTIIYYLSGETVPVGIGYFLINILLVAIALKVLGPKFGIKTIFAIIIGSAFLSFLQPLFQLYFPNGIIDDMFMSAIIAGMLTGIGIAMALSEGGSTGGTDIVAMIVTKYRNVSPGKMIMYCDCGIIACSLLINLDDGYQRAIQGVMYGYVMMGVVSYTVDFILTGKKQSAQLMIFTDKYEEVAERITQEVNHAVSVVDCKGWYTGLAKKMLIIVVRKNEAVDVLRIAKKVDPNVFMTMNTVMGVFGKGFDEVKGIK